jgi:hypothetical protein
VGDTAGADLEGLKEFPSEILKWTIGNMPIIMKNQSRTWAIEPPLAAQDALPAAPVTGVMKCLYTA